MDRDEALHVLAAASFADGHCSSCYEMVIERLEEFLPTVPWADLADEAWDRGDAIYYAPSTEE